MITPWERCIAVSNVLPLPGEMLSSLSFHQETCAFIYVGHILHREGWWIEEFFRIHVWINEHFLDLQGSFSFFFLKSFELPKTRAPLNALVVCLFFAGGSVLASLSKAIVALPK